MLIYMTWGVINGFYKVCSWLYKVEICVIFIRNLVLVSLLVERLLKT